MHGSMELTIVALTWPLGLQSTTVYTLSYLYRSMAHSMPYRAQILCEFPYTIITGSWEKGKDS